MSEVLIIVHLLIVLGLIGIVLLQRSEGGGLGMGSSGGGFMTSRGKANALTRTTTILGGMFFITSILLAILAAPTNGPRSVFDATPTINDKAAPVQDSGQGGNGILDQLPPSQEQQQTAPLQAAPPPPAAPQAPISR